MVVFNQPGAMTADRDCRFCSRMSPWNIVLVTRKGACHRSEAQRDEKRAEIADVEKYDALI
jgi:hypothetical protein